MPTKLILHNLFYGSYAKMKNSCIFRLDLFVTHQMVDEIIFIVFKTNLLRLT